MDDFLGDADGDLLDEQGKLRDKYRNARHFKMKSTMLSWAEVLAKAWNKAGTSLIVITILLGFGIFLSLIVQYQIHTYNEDSACILVCHPEDMRLHDDVCWCLPPNDKAYKKDTGELP